MMRRVFLSGLAFLACASSAFAQEAGGLRLAPGIGAGPVGLARPLLSAPMPFVTAHDLQNGMTAASHQAQNQAMISRLRGDAGYLGGFRFGTPFAASRQVPVPMDTGGAWDGSDPQQGRTIIINEGPLAITNGNGNVIQLQSANSPGPIGQQQVATAPGEAAGGAVNRITGDGNIVQRTR